MKNFIKSYYLGLQILGCLLIVLATYRLNTIAAIYVAGGMILVWGILEEYASGAGPSAGTPGEGTNGGDNGNR